VTHFAHSLAASQQRAHCAHVKERPWLVRRSAHEIPEKKRSSVSTLLQRAMRRPAAADRRNRFRFDDAPMTPSTSADRSRTA
jgi:hypothetical protein